MFDDKSASFIPFITKVSMTFVAWSFTYDLRLMDEKIFNIILIGN